MTSVLSLYNEVSLSLLTENGLEEGAAEVVAMRLKNRGTSLVNCIVGSLAKSKHSEGREVKEYVNGFCNGCGYGVMTKKLHSVAVGYMMMGSGWMVEGRRNKEGGRAEDGHLCQVRRSLGEVALLLPQK